jgi:mannose-6-phosphate isomerase-like protein (cupin superfamily)
MNANAMEKKSLNKPDETRSFDKGMLEVVKLERGTIGRATFQPGWKWSQCVKPIAKTDSCQTHHFGYVVSGRMKVVMNDKSEVEYGPGDAMNIPPGHDAWILGDEPCVCIDVTGAEHYAERK